MTAGEHYIFSNRDAVVRRYLTVDGLLKPPPMSLPTPEEAKKKRAA